MTFNREVKTAIVVLTALIAAIWGYNYLKGKDIFNSYNTYYAIADNAEGLIKSTPVSLKGIQIGTLENLEFYNGFEKTLLILNIKNDFKFTKDSKVRIYGGNIMGGKSVAIVPGTASQMAKDGDTLAVSNMPGIFDLVNERLTPLQDKLERILNSTDTLLLSINHIMTPETQSSLKRTIASLETTLHHFKNTSRQIDNLLSQNKEHFSKSFENIDKLSTNFGKISDSLKQIQWGNTVQSLNKTIQNLNIAVDKLNKGDGTMAKLMNDKKLYENLEKSTKELELLLKDLREHPKKYVHFSIWGRKDKKKK